MTHIIAGEIMSREITPFALRMRPELRKKVEEAAAENKRSLNAEISARLEQSFARKDPSTNPEEQLYSVAEIKYFIEKATKDFIAEKLAEKSKE